MHADPVKGLVDLVTQGLIRPRQLTRRLIDARLSTDDRWRLVALAALMQLSFVVLARLLIGIGWETGVFEILFILFLDIPLFVGQFFAFVAIATLASEIGRRLGGERSDADVSTAVALCSVLGAALTPLALIVLGTAMLGRQNDAAAALAPLLFCALSMLIIWLLASCIAEAHRFSSTMRVARVTLTVYVALCLALYMLLY